MSSSFTAKSAFIIAIGLLLACAILVYSTLESFARSEYWAEHSQEVRGLLGEAESDIAAAARFRLVYVLDGNQDSLAQYRGSVGEIPVVLHHIRQLTADNPVQQRNCERLEAAVDTRIQLWEKSIALKASGTPMPEGQPGMTRQSLEFANDIVAITKAMADEERRLFEERARSAHIHFALAIVVIIVTFSAAVLLLLWHYKLLRAELHAREEAERAASNAAKAALESEQKAHEAQRAAVAGREAVGQLTARLLKLQDDERRRFSRELHDSIGQYLAAAKMLLSAMALGRDPDPRFAECVKLLDQSIKEVRTLSHLLHPPGLDEAGFSSAAKWYAEEFAKRSGLELTLNFADLPTRLRPALELALFRILQESLTNIHRHSKSKSGEVLFEVTSDNIVLTVSDHGRGIPQDVLDRFQVSGTSGVGLAGMRERVRELGGRFEVESGNSGTCVRVTVPVRAGQFQQGKQPAGESEGQSFAAEGG